MNEYQTFYVQKSPQAFSDTLVTFGLATIIEDLLERQDSGQITITDKGIHYELSLSTLLLKETVVQQVSSLQPIPAIETEKTDLSHGIASENYSHHLEVADTYFKTRGQENATEPPDIRLNIWKAINDFSKFNVRNSYNSLIEYWFFARQQAETLFILLDLFSNPNNDYEHAVMRWQDLSKQQEWGLHSKTDYEVTQLQIFNPTSGKGQNKVKANGLSISNVSGFWLIEWLKAVGIYAVGLTKYLGATGDQKTLVLAPHKLTFNQHRRIMSKFRNKMIGSQTATKFDILAAIRYTEALLDYVMEVDDPLLELFGLGEIKQTVVSGFYTAFYKNMGSALATMNLSFIALPNWVIVQSAEDIPTYQAMLEELEQVVRQFNESHSDDITLLHHMCDFISGDEIKSFLEFTTGFASYYMREKEDNPYLKLLSTQLVERMVNKVGKIYADIANREKYQGFHNIARAISESTIIAQWRSPQNKTYQIRYGLHRDLARKSQTWEKFLTALSEFIYTYNAETSRAQELGLKPWRPMVEANDIQNVLRMQDDYADSQMVAKLLIAFGSTFLLPKKEENEQE